MTKYCTLLVGPPGSGKSTLAHNLIYNDGDIAAMQVRISQDDDGKVGHMTKFLAALASGKDVIVDRMNFSKEQRSRYLDQARVHNYYTKIIVLQVPREVCGKRMLPRFQGKPRMGEERLHPTIHTAEQAQSALHTFYTKYEKPTPDEATEVVFRGHEAADRERCIIVDLDGTLCNIDHRLIHVQKMDLFGEKVKPNWKAFFEGIPNDVPNTWCWNLAQSMANNGISVVLASGRPDDHRKETEAWLARYAFDFHDALYMRGRNDFRKDDIVKEIILDFEILPRYRPLFAVDDRKQVVDMWRRRGITCLHCAEGDF